MHIYRHTIAYASKLVEGRLFESERAAADFDIDTALARLEISSQPSAPIQDAIIYLAEHIQYERAIAGADPELVEQQEAAE
jgi:hypothetical protein